MCLDIFRGVCVCICVGANACVRMHMYAHKYGSQKTTSGAFPEMLSTWVLHLIWSFFSPPVDFCPFVCFILRQGHSVAWNSLEARLAVQ